MLNINTGNISPQFHLVHDDYFQTVHANPDITPDIWPELIQFHRHQTNFDPEEPVPALSKEWDPPAETPVPVPEPIVPPSPPKS